MTSRHLTLRQRDCNLTGNDVTSPLATDSQHQPYCQNGYHLADYIVSNILMKAHGRKFDKERQKLIQNSLMTLIHGSQVSDHCPFGYLAFLSSNIAAK